MKITCKNCGNEFEGSYCNRCGQSADTQPLNFTYIRKNLQGIVFEYFSSGILYSSKQLLKRPGHTIREYLEGKRVDHEDPISLLITFGALYALLYHSFGINTMGSADANNAVEMSLNSWIIDHYALVTGITLPFYATICYLFFRKQGHNFIELIILNTFLACQRLLVHFLLIPVQLIMAKVSMANSFSYMVTLIDAALLIWGYTQFFNNVPLKKAILLSTLSYFMFFILVLVIAVGAFFIFTMLLI